MEKCCLPKRSQFPHPLSTIELLRSYNDYYSQVFLKLLFSFASFFMSAGHKSVRVVCHIVIYSIKITEQPCHPCCQCQYAFLLKRLLMSHHLKIFFLSFNLFIIFTFVLAVTVTQQTQLLLIVGQYIKFYAIILPSDIYSHDFDELFPIIRLHL